MFGALGALDESPLSGSPFEGAFIWTPFATIPPTMDAGPGGFVGAQGGVAMGRFAWADYFAGTAGNSRTDSSQRLGFVLPRRGGWTWVYSEGGVWFSRGGLPVTLATGGNFWARFVGGAYVGQRVYADLLDGHCISGEATGAELTPWTVASNAEPGNLAMISTTNFFGA